MEHEFMSDAWLAALAERLRGNEGYKKAAKDLKASMALTLLPDADKGIEPCAIVLDLQAGELASATRVAGPGPYEADYVIRGVADNWKKLLSKEIFPVPAIMKGDLQLVKGGATALMMKMNAVQAMLDEAAAVPTKWPG